MRSAQFLARGLAVATALTCVASTAAGEPSRPESLALLMEAYVPCEDSDDAIATMRREVSDYTASRVEVLEALAALRASPTACSRQKQLAKALTALASRDPAGFDLALGVQIAARPEEQPVRAGESPVALAAVGFLARSRLPPPMSTHLKRSSDF